MEETAEGERCFLALWDRRACDAIPWGKVVMSTAAFLSIEPLASIQQAVWCLKCNLPRLVFRPQILDSSGLG